MIYIAAESLKGNRLSLKQISSEIESPTAFTAKILQQLVRNELLSSVMGPTGGFQISGAKINKIRLSQIVNVLDGDAIYKGCGLGLKKCNASKPCPVHRKFASIRDELKDMLEGTTLYELAVGLENETTFLKR